MRTFAFTMYIKTANQEFVIGRAMVQANNADDALRQFNRKDLPFHHFATYQII